MCYTLSVQTTLRIILPSILTLFVVGCAVNPTIPIVELTAKAMQNWVSDPYTFNLQGSVHINSLNTNVVIAIEGTAQAWYQDTYLLAMPTVHIQGIMQNVPTEIVATFKIVRTKTGITYIRLEELDNKSTTSTFLSDIALQKWIILPSSDVHSASWEQLLANPYTATGSYTYAPKQVKGIYSLEKNVTVNKALLANSAAIMTQSLQIDAKTFATHNMTFTGKIPIANGESILDLQINSIQTEPKSIFNLPTQ